MIRTGFFARLAGGVQIVRRITAGAGITVTNGDGEGGDVVIEASGAGDVVGPGSATDNAIARFDSTTGKLIQNSGITIADGASGTLSGTNTGDQTITLSGDVTGSGTGAISTTIANDAVTYAKLQNVAGLSVVGKATTGSGDAADITAATEGQFLRRLGNTLAFQFLEVVSKAINYTITGADDVVIVTAAGVVITLPTAVGIKGRVYIIKRNHGGAASSIDCTGGETIDGSATKTLSPNYTAFAVVSDNANWSVI